MKGDDIPAERIIDVMVAESIMGFLRITCDDYDGVLGPFADLVPPDTTLAGKASWRVAPTVRLWKYALVRVPHYTTDIEAAWTIVERLEAFQWTLTLERVGHGWQATFTDPEHQEGALGVSAPHAICIAAARVWNVVRA